MSVAASKPTEQPNVLLVTADHWFGRLLGCAGHPIVQTPTLDVLASNGVRFTRAYSETPVCIPARRSLMTGMSPRGHGCRTQDEHAPMPDVPTMAQCFRDAGYQAHAAGKLHVRPQRSRIGFDDVTLVEEGRTQFGASDDFEQYLVEAGFGGEQFTHGLSNNGYEARPWHLPEHVHVTNWITRQMARQIKRRDPQRPAFWYLSYTAPHPPLAPLAAYMDLYRGMNLDSPVVGDWVPGASPYPLQAKRTQSPQERLVEEARRAFYALCTHVDHQLRVVIGTLREEGLLDNTIIVFTADHGEMLGDHDLWAKGVFYEGSANIPLIVSGRPGDNRIGTGETDDRLVGLQDVMPSLLDLAGIDVPPNVEGRAMFGRDRRNWLFGEYQEDAEATRMMHDGRHKLIYYPAGNCTQLFDLDVDPRECVDVSASPAYAQVREHLTAQLVKELYGGDERWVDGARLIGVPNKTGRLRPMRDLFNQRGLH